MIDKDDEFLLWISNRLVNKYGENPEIVNRMIGIVAKNRLIRSSYKEGNKNSMLAIGNTIRYLENLQKVIRTQHESLVSKISEKTPQEKLEKLEKTDFDNIDMESILRGI